MMDCDTTGIEPDIALIKYKQLVGGGMIKIVNNTVPEALAQARLRRRARSKAIVEYIDDEETIEGAPGLKAEHLPVFDCAFRAANGTRSIHYMGHIRMMAAVQPFLSGAISKTVNLPPDAHRRGHRGRVHGGVEAGAEGDRGLPRRLQADPAAVDQQDATRAGQDDAAAAAEAPVERPAGGGAQASCPTSGSRSRTSSRSRGHEGYITVGLYETASRARSS